MPSIWHGAASARRDAAAAPLGSGGSGLAAILAVARVYVARPAAADAVVGVLQGRGTAELTPDKKRPAPQRSKLNPAYARYYTETEARALLEEAGFVDATSFHRHRYSWAVVGRRPITTA